MSRVMGYFIDRETKWWKNFDQLEPFNFPILCVFSHYIKVCRSPQQHSLAALYISGKFLF